MTGSLARVLPISLVEPDGLIVTTDGRYVRLIECDRVPNTITADPSELARIERCFAHAVPDHPRPPGPVDLRADRPGPDRRSARRRPRRRPGGRGRRTGRRPRTSSRARASGCWRRPADGDRGRRRRAAGGRGALVGRRPLPAGDRGQRASSCAALAAGARGRTLWETHRRPRSRACGSPTRSTRCCAAPGSTPGCWTAPRRSRCCGSAFTPPPSSPSTATCSRGSPTRARSRRDHARARPPRPPPDARGDLRAAPSCGIDSARTRRGCATPTGRWRRRSISRRRRWRPTRRGWRTCSCCPLPATLAVHIAVGVRSREKHRQRRRWQRLRAAVRYKDRRDRLVGSDEEDALEEAAVIDAELAAEVGATVYRGRDLLLDPRPARRRRELRADRQADLL